MPQRHTCYSSILKNRSTGRVGNCLFSVSEDFARVLISWFSFRYKEKLTQALLNCTELFSLILNLPKNKFLTLDNKCYSFTVASSHSVALSGPLVPNAQAFLPIHTSNQYGGTNPLPYSTVNLCTSLFRGKFHWFLGVAFPQISVHRNTACGKQSVKDLLKSNYSMDITLRKCS